MIKKLFLFIGILILAAIAFYLYFFRYNSTLSSRDTRFSVNKKLYNHVVITEKNKKVELVKSPSGWTIDGKEVNQEQLKNLLFATGNLEVVAPVSNSGNDTILKHLKSGIHVKFFHGYRRINAFSLCKLNDQIYAKRFYSRKSFRISIKGYAGADLSQVYSPDSLSWKKDYLIKTTIAAINKVILLYPTHPEKSFILEKDKQGKYLLLDPIKQKKLGQVDTTHVHNFIDLLPTLNYKKPDNIGSIPEDSLKIKDVFFILQVSDKNDHTLEIKGFPKVTANRGGPIRSEFYALTSTKGLVSLKYSEFDPILLPRDYFLKK